MFELLLGALGPPLARLLAKTYFGEVGAVLTGGAADIIKAKITDARQRRDAERLVDDLTDRTLASLLPVFERERAHDLNPEAVALELGQALERGVTVESLLSDDLDAERVRRALDTAHTLPRGFSTADTDLYRRALRPLALALTEIAPKLPRFDSRYPAESLRRLREVTDKADEILTVVLRLDDRARRRDRDADEDDRWFEEIYRQAVRNKLDHIELLGVDVDEAARRLPLSVAYVSLQLAEAAGSGHPGRTLGFASLLDDLEDHRGVLLVLGNAGTGKSTLFRWAAVQANGRWREQIGSEHLGDAAMPDAGQTDTPREPIREGPAATADVPDRAPGGDFSFAGRGPRLDFRKRGLWCRRVPFLLRLRDCPDGRLPAPEDFPALIGREIGGPPESWVERVLRDGRGLVLLDGFDEIPPERRGDAKLAIETFIGVWRPRGNLILVSSRPAAIEDRWSLDGLREAEINPLSDLDRTHLVDQWHHALAAQKRTDEEREQVLAKASQLKAKLREHPHVAQLATNPLLCCAVCALHVYRRGLLPLGLRDLCEKLCEMLVDLRDRQALEGAWEKFPPAWRTLDYANKREILRRIASAMVVTGRSQLRRDDKPLELTRTALSGYGRDAADAPVVLRLLVERSGLLRAAGADDIEFIHNTLKEYLAADDLVERRQEEFLVQHVANRNWHPVIVLASARANEQVARTLIEAALAAAEGVHSAENGADATMLRVLALRCQAVTGTLPEELRARLAAVENAILPPRDPAVADDLATLGDRIVDRLRQRDDRDESEAAACVRTLRLIGSTIAHNTLAGYHADRRDAVVAELAQAMNPLELDAVLERLKRGGRLREAIARYVVDLAPLAGLAGLQRLDLSGAGVGDLAPLAGLAGLQGLDLSGTGVGDLAPLAGLAGLEWLNLISTGVGDLAPLAGLAGLKTLGLSYTRVGDLAPLAGLAGLQTLLLSGTEVGDLAPLAGLAGLKTLGLSYTRVSDLAPLAGLAGLQTLDLKGTGAGDLAPLAGLAGLQRLDLSGTGVSDLAPLAGLAGLQSLDLSGTGAGDLAPLAGLAGLQRLVLRDTQVPPEEVERLRAALAARGNSGIEVVR